MCVPNLKNKLMYPSTLDQDHKRKKKLSCSNLNHFYWCQEHHQASRFLLPVDQFWLQHLKPKPRAPSSVSFSTTSFTSTYQKTAFSERRNNCSYWFQLFHHYIIVSWLRTKAISMPEHQLFPPTPHAEAQRRKEDRCPKSQNSFQQV